MDAITLALAKQYTDSQRLGYIEKPADIEWDGNITGREPTIFKMEYIDAPGYRIHNDVIDIEKIDMIHLGFATPDGTFTVASLGMESFEVRHKDNKVIELWSDVDGGEILPILKICMEDCDSENGRILCGVYSAHLELESNTFFIATGIEFSETIHPIDPKLIPVMDSLTLSGADGKQYKLTVDANGALTHTAIE